MYMETVDVDDNSPRRTHGPRRPAAVCIQQMNPMNSRNVYMVVTKTPQTSTMLLLGRIAVLRT